MPPTTKIGGGGWSCGARAKHHHRKRLRNPEFFALRTTTYGVASSSCRASRRRQRQQLALRATSRWRGGAKQIALAPREGQALEERSSSSRSTRRPRTRGQQLPCVRRRQRQQLAPRASRWRRGGAKQIALAPREGQALEERSSSSRSTRRPRTRGSTAAVRTTTTTAAARAAREQMAPRRRRAESPRTSRRAGARRTCRCCARTSRIGTATYAWRPAAVRHHDDNGGSSRATGAESKRALRACARIRQGLRPCRPRPEGGRAAQHARLQERTPCVTTTTAAYVDVTRRRR